MRTDALCSNAILFRTAVEAIRRYSVSAARSFGNLRFVYLLMLYIVLAIFPEADKGHILLVLYGYSHGFAVHPADLVPCGIVDSPKRAHLLHFVITFLLMNSHSEYLIIEQIVNVPNFRAKF